MTETNPDVATLAPARRELLERLRAKQDEGELKTYPLSFAQERLWFLDQLEPDSSFYNLPLAFHVRGPLAVAALEHALREIVRRHQALRTRIVAVRGRPAQVVERQVRLALPQIDLGRLDADRASAELERQARLEARRPFNLARGPMLRLLLFRLAANHHGLVINLHHVAGDGWSLGILMREVTALYEAFAAGRPSPLEELSIQYPDFAVWQRRWLEGEGVEQQLAYWRRQLAGASPLLALPTDRPRPLVQTYRGATVFLPLGAELTRQVEQLAREERATVFAVLLAVFAALLARVSASEDVVVGTAVANRNHPQTEGLIGSFVNSLVLRTDLSGDPDFRRLIERVRRVVLEAYAHQDLPFERLVEAIQPARELSYSPLFQVMLVLGNTPRGEVELSAGLELEPIAFDIGTAQFDLNLYTSETARGLSIAWHYNLDLFDRSTVARLAACYRRLLAAALAEPARPIGALSGWSLAERQQALVEWNDTAVELVPGLGVHTLIEQQARRTPRAQALVAGDTVLSYEELDHQANRLARHLAARGVGGGVVVGLHLEREPQAVVAMLAVLKSGAAYLPLDPSYPRERLAFMLADAGAGWLLTRGRDGAELATAGIEVVDLDAESAAIAAQAAEAPAMEIDDRALAYVLYTSGSTGRPKGVMVPHRSVVSFFIGMDARLGGRAPGTWLAVTSISFDISVLELLWTLARGFRTVIGGEAQMPSMHAAPARPAARAAREMQFSLFFFAADHAGAADPYRLLLESARFADRRGFTAVWTPERHFHAFGGLYPNPSVTGAALATLTERIQIRAGSVVLPLHHPVRVAEEWSLVDNLSKGRVAVSFASGWHADDFVFAPESFADRKEVMRRDVEIVRRLWRGETVELVGGLGQPVAVAIHPRPVQAELPTWITAGGHPDTFRTAGELGANLLTHLLGQSVEELAGKIAIYREAYRSAGRGRGDGCVSLMLHTFLGDDLESVRNLVRGPFREYLRSAGGLVANLARASARGGELEPLAAEEVEAVLDHAFERYFGTSGLMGTFETCAAMVERLRAIGVDELCCLIDFGVDDERTLASLEKLDELRRQTNAPVAMSAIPAPLLLHRPSHLQCTPSMAAVLAADPANAAVFGSLECLMLGGEALPPALAEQLRELGPTELHNMYGPTETTIWSTTARLAPGGARMTIGRPIANTRVYVLDRRLRPVPVGAMGQLMIAGEGVARGYLARPGASAEKFLPDPFGAPGSRLYATGDLARQRPDGDLEILGRVDHQVKIRGYRIELGEIESVLCRHPSVREAVVVSRQDPGHEPQLVAYVVAEQSPWPAPRPRLDPAEQQRLLAGRSSFELPNGMTVTHYDRRQANALYREVFLEQVYARHGITYADGDCIFDVGANAGFFTLFASHACKPSRIFAFEPIPDNCQLLRVNTALYGCPVEIFECGVADAPGSAEFVFYPNAAGLSGRAFDVEQDLQELRTFARRGLGSALDAEARAGLSDQEVEDALAEHLRHQSYECRLITLSDVIREHGVERIDLLKVDAEKSEVHVLEGLAESDWPKIRQVMLEVHGRSLLERTRAILEHHGFTLAVDEELALDDAGDGSELYVYMVFARRPEEAESRRAAGGLSLGELRAHLRERLPGYMVPSIFVPLEALPRTANGKVDRKALPIPDTARRSTATDYVAPRTETEQRLAQIWQELLRMERIGLEDNFFEVGGTSLLLVQAHQRLRRELAVEVSLVEMFRHPTVGAMAAYLGGERKEPAAVAQSRERARQQSEAVEGSALLERQRRFLEQRRQRRQEA